MTESSIIPWNKTDIFRFTNKQNFRYNIFKLCGPSVFGTSVPDSVEFTMRNIIEKLRNAVFDPFYTHIPTGTIIAETPSQKEYVRRLVERLKNERIPNNKKECINIKDAWAENAGVRPLYKCPQFNCPRFVPIPEENTEIYYSNFLTDILIVGHLNSSNFRCPTCNQRRKIGIIKYSSDITMGFKNAMCLGCEEQGIRTVFSFRTKMKKNIHNFITGGNLTTLNSLMATRTNIYIIVLSQDTGRLRIGKVDGAHLRVNYGFLYSIQEHIKLRSPSTTVLCSLGFKNLLNIPFPIQTHDSRFCQYIKRLAMEDLAIIDQNF